MKMNGNSAKDPSNQQADEASQVKKGKKNGISRRSFLKAAGAAVAGTVVVSGCEVIAPGAAQPPPLPVTSLPVRVQYPEVPYAPLTPPEPGFLRFFSVQEARLVEALTARILPGTPEDPGAREAGVVNYIDHMLAHEEGFPEAIYREPPYAQTFKEDNPPPEMGQEGSFQVIWVPDEEIERYGYQSMLTPREVYRIGLAAVGRFAQEQFGTEFIELSEEQQDQIIQAMADDEATGFEPISAEAFFQVLRRHTMEGMFSDPAYGGNREKAGWWLIGYPGAQRAYTVEDLHTEGYFREPWSMADLPHFHPGELSDPNAIVPPRGPEERQQGR